MASPPSTSSSSKYDHHQLTPLPTTFDPDEHPPTPLASDEARRDGLVPLPTEFDPESALTAPTQGESGLADSGDSFAPPHLSIDTEEDAKDRSDAEKHAPQSVIGAPGRVGDIINDHQETNASTPEAVEQIEEREEVNDPALMVILQSLQASREEYPEEKEEPQETALSSPLSDLPDLPTELPPSPEPPTPPPAPPSPLPPVRKASPPISRALPAESSSAPHRATSPAAGPTIQAAKGKRDRQDEVVLSESVPKIPRPSSNGKERAGSQGRTAERIAQSEKLRDVREVKVEGANSSMTPEEGAGSDSDGAKKKLKRQKGPDGKPVRVKSRKLLDQVLGIGRDGDIPPEKIAPRGKVFSDAQLKQSLEGKTTEVQVAPCLRPRYSKWGKCTQCVSKVGGDSCRFRDYRVFKIDPETTEILGPGWFDSTEWKDELTKLPRDFNVPLSEVHMRRIEQTVAPLVLPLITRELRHVVKNKAIKRGMDAAKHRAVCDFCSSTIFGGWFFCKKCGRDYCLVCERYFADNFEKMGESPWHLPDAARPRLLRCVIQSEMPDQASKPTGRSPAFHFRPDLQPVSRFSEEELRSHWISLAEFVLANEGSVGDRLKLLGLHSATENVVGQMQDWVTSLSSPPPSPKPPLSEQEVKDLYTKKTHPSAVVVDPAGMEERNMEFMFIHNDKLSLEVFDQLWARGEPIVVDGVGDQLKMSWTPDDFIERFGSEQCVLVDCQKNTSEVKTIQRFFELFKDRENRSNQILKLKDWPTTDDFANTHPELYDDFCDALPVPDYTRREGVLNLYAHFPPGPTRPDIGPKMYNAFEAVETQGGHGSTRLHMDVADAVNVMLYASTRKDESPGCAVWDLFRAEDADKIRLYLKGKFDKTHKFTDPIHSQLFYLDTKMRKELKDRYDVVSWRVYQYPGQAVFIPAGCAHQVCNLADCIKIALDFVSTHNVSRCQQLTQDFRTENFVKAWKDDVLQLYNVLWYAWTNVRETRERRIEEDKAREEEARSRAARLASLQNGNHDHHDRSPVSVSPFPSFMGIHRHSVLSPNISSVRDEERAPSTAHPSRAGSPQSVSATGRGSVDEESKQPQQPDQESGVGKKEDADARETGDTGPPASRLFAEKLLDATLSASEPPPPPEARAPSTATKWVAKIPLKALPKKEERSRFDRFDRPGRSMRGKEKEERNGGGEGTTAIRTTRMTTSQLIKSGVLPIDLAVSAARLQMGEGAEGEDGDGAAGEDGGPEVTRADETAEETAAGNGPTTQGEGNVEDIAAQDADLPAAEEIQLDQEEELHQTDGLESLHALFTTEGMMDLDVDVLGGSAGEAAEKDGIMG